MGRWEFWGRNHMRVAVESDDAVLDDRTAYHNLELALATAEDEFVAEAMVRTRFSETHEVDHAEADRSLDQVSLVATIKMRRRTGS